MRRIHLIVAGLLTLAPMTGFIQAQAQAQSTGFSPRPAESGAQAFALGATTASQFAIAASHQALKKSLDLKVKKLAEQIIADYEAGLSYILETAASANLRIPETLDAEHSARLERLAAAGVGQIDTRYRSEVGRVHEAAIALFTGYIRSGDNLRFRLIAARALPTLKDHYANVQQLAQR